ncbi:MAG: DNA polymerase Y family protein [Aliiglaciecola sp.]
MQTLWLYLHFPHLQLDGLTDASESAEYPLIILHDKSNTVLQLNQAAIDAGIRRGMGLGTAAALNEHLQVLAYRKDVEHKKLLEIAEHLYLVTSDICLFPPDGLLLRIHNMLRLYGGLAAYWRTLKAQLAHFPVYYHYATGQSPYAARILSRTAWNQVSDHLPMHKHQMGLRALSESELDEKTINKLKRVGIHSIGDLLGLSLKDIAKRFDIDLVTYLGRLTGEFHHPIHFFHPQSKFNRYLELLYEISHADTLLRPMQRLLGGLEQFLKLRDSLTHKVIFTLHQRDAEDLILEVGSAQAEYQAAKWLSLTELKLQQLQLQSPVYALNLCTGKTQLRSPDRGDLFTASKGTLSCLQLISLLQAKLGEQAIGQVILQDDFRPDQVNRYLSFQDGVAEQAKAANIDLQAVRPSFLLKEAQPLNEKVTIMHGPERISTGWWDNGTMTRDYFVAHNLHGQWLWVYRTPSAQWYVHGLFS